MKSYEPRCIKFPGINLVVSWGQPGQLMHRQLLVVNVHRYGTCARQRAIVHCLWLPWKQMVVVAVVAAKYPVPQQELDFHHPDPGVWPWHWWLCLTLTFLLLELLVVTRLPLTAVNIMHQIQNAFVNRPLWGQIRALMICDGNSMEKFALFSLKINSWHFLRRGGHAVCRLKQRRLPLFSRRPASSNSLD